uniref:RWD domain-containing protein n=1 Tax=Ascaris lumbricoides TaxID=6252 RepID=A0A0M3I7I1_ASCLU
MFCSNLMGDKEAQSEEIQSIEAIFGDLVHLESTARINVQFEHDIQLTIDLPPDYPSCSPPCFELTQLEDIYLQNIGQPILYEWIECINLYLSQRNDNLKAGNSSIEEEPSSSDVIIRDVSVIVPEIISGDILQDRKSTFQAHVALINSENEVMLVLNKLKENGKIARATHNMYAWRIEESIDGRIIKRHDCEDDGEIGAGAKLLHLLELMKAKNVIVIVTRWYGGIHLGPDRFRHICNIAREILVQNGFSNRS